ALSAKSPSPIAVPPRIRRPPRSAAARLTLPSTEVVRNREGADRATSTGNAQMLATRASPRHGCREERERCGGAEEQRCVEATAPVPHGGPPRIRQEPQDS